MHGTFVPPIMIKRERRTQPCLFMSIKSSSPHLFDYLTVAKSQSPGRSTLRQFSHCGPQSVFTLTHQSPPIIFQLYSSSLSFQPIAMASKPYSSNELGSLVAMAGANPIHANSLSFPDHQSASYQFAPTFQPDALATTLHFPNDVSAPITAPVTERSGWAARQVWARHQALIKQLYLYEKRPLAEVMRLMESQHGFRATLVFRAVLFVSSIADVP